LLRCCGCWCCCSSLVPCGGAGCRCTCGSSGRCGSSWGCCVCCCRCFRPCLRCCRHCCHCCRCRRCCWCLGCCRPQLKWSFGSLLVLPLSLPHRPRAASAHPSKFLQTQLSKTSTGSPLLSRLRCRRPPLGGVPRIRAPPPGMLVAKVPEGAAAVVAADPCASRGSGEGEPLRRIGAAVKATVPLHRRAAGEGGCLCCFGRGGRWCWCC